MKPRPEPKTWRDRISGARKIGTTLALGCGGAAGFALVIISCGTVGHTILAPPSIPGAEFVGSEECSNCHDEITSEFKTATHARMVAKGPHSPDMGCEGCHGPGSKHTETGGGAGSIINPRKSPEVCFQCHLDKQAEFNLPYSHPVLSGKMSCVDCHDPHKGSALKGGGTRLARMNDICFKCHSAQRGPFVFRHQAVREGCTSCHNPHGSVNQKMLTERNATLCMKCHFQQQTADGKIMIGDRDHSRWLGRGTCWSGGCHEAVHGSNVNDHLRY